jgi:hypothetical protein
MLPLRSAVVHVPFAERSDEPNLVLEGDFQLRLQTILATHQLLDPYGYVAERNPSNAFPYHNLHHTRCVLLNCADGADQMELPFEERRTLYLAALFHDFGHSGGRQKDAQNVGVAIDALRAYCTKARFLDDCLDAATRIIESTEFPPLADPVTLSEKIIRDADMMQIYMPRWREQIFGGLRNELEVATGKEISHSNMVRLQLRFMEGVKWHTSWATRRAEREWAKRIEEVRSLDV